MPSGSGPVFAINISLENLPVVLRAFYDVIDAIPDGTLARAYNKGANQGGGDYEHYVQSSQYQAWMHQGRWQTDEDAVEDLEDVAHDYWDKHLGLKINPRGMKQDVHAFASDLAGEIEAYMKNYPPPPAASQYIRTYTLHGAWDKEIFV